MRAIETNPQVEYSPTTILVKFEAHVPENNRAAARGLVGGGVVRQYRLVAGLEHIEIAIPVEQAIAAFRAMPFVVYAEPDYILRTATTPNDPHFGNMWGMQNIRAPEAWDVSTGSGGFVVAIIDTGIQYTHSDLVGNIWVNTGESAEPNGQDNDGNGYIDDRYGWDFYDNNNDPWDKNGHGTHVAGTVGAVGNNGIGVVGVNWNCQLMALRFIGPRGGFTSDAISAIEYAVNKGVKVSNNSWGGGAESQALRDAIAWAGGQGHIFVTAAGNNNGRNIDTNPVYPASYNLPNMITVAGIDSNDNLASFSNIGPQSVHLGAPGVSILSTYRNNGYAYAGGTSMAAPHVAGAAALYWALDTSVSMSNVRERILTTVRPLASLTNKTVTGGTLDVAVVMGADPAPGGGGGGGGSPAVPPPAPSSVTATAIGGGSAEICWTHDSEATDYLEMQRWRLQGAVWRKHADIGPIAGSASCHIDSPGSGAFRYRVRAVNAEGASDWSPYSNNVTVN